LAGGSSVHLIAELLAEPIDLGLGVLLEAGVVVAA
jgi:hypothetical protein